MSPDDEDAARGGAGGGGLPPRPAAHRVTLALIAARSGDRRALDEAFRLVYDEIRAIARARLGYGARRATLDTTAVVHEAYLKIVRHGEMEWRDRRHFLAVAASAMRQVLLDHARKQLASKRGGGASHLPLDAAETVLAADARELLALDGALGRLAAVDSELAKLVEMRYFGGLSVEETARALDVSAATVKRSWRKARAFLHRELTGGSPA